jgi:hypothetical protein
LAAFLKTCGWLMILVATVAIVYPFLNPPSNLSPLVAALPGGVLVAIGAQLLSQGKHFSEQAERDSLFYLESTVKAFEEARDLLQDGNNDRKTWIAAGRALMHAKELAGRVKADSHKRVLELHRLKFRGFFHDVLYDKSAAFFYGATNPAVPIDDAARESTAADNRGGRMVASTLKSLSEKSIRAVWEAAQWPTEYADPLDSNFSDQEVAKLFVLFRGLNEYLEHTRRWHSAAGALHPRERQGDRAS